MRAAGLALILGLAAGCGAGDPETSRLAAGREAITVDLPPHPSGHAMGNMLVLPRRPEGEVQPFWPAIDRGTRVVVVDDAGRGEDNPSRPVLVKVEDGEEAGKAGYLPRGGLRPVR